MSVNSVAPPVVGALTGRVRFTLVGLAIGLLLSAYLYGDYLLGTAVGVVYLLVTAGMLWLMKRSWQLDSFFSFPRAVLILLTVGVAWVMIDPAEFSRDLEGDIDRHRDERAITDPVNKIFWSEFRYWRLGLKVERVKATYFTIVGSVNSKADLEALQNRMREEVPSVRRDHALRWNVWVRSTQGYLVGGDHVVFPEADGLK